MTLFHTLYLCRSDGKLEIASKSKVREKNEPTKEQLDSKPDAKGVSDYYRLMSKQDAKHLDWRRKLAAMLVREIGTAEYSNDKAYILNDFPENYRLYEHIKSKAADAEAKATKAHAAGGNERQDAYLYGHPGGRKKRYRSPADYFPHLLWLCTDKSGEHLNCSCKICAPDEMQPEVTKSSDALRGSLLMKVQSQAPQAITSLNPVVEIPGRSVAQSDSITQPVIRNQIAHPPTASPVPRVTQTPIPQSSQARPESAVPPVSQSIDQQIDLAPNNVPFRTGEVIWFHRPERNSWGLGVLFQRWVVRNALHPVRNRYRVQPLSAPTISLNSVIIESDRHVRPFLAWSPPAYCHDGLNRIVGATYANVDWLALSGGRYGVSNATIVEVDASILAAKAIDATFTPFGYLNSTPMLKNHGSAEPNFTTHQISWSGVYLGGEKLWVGDPVVPRDNTNEDVLVISQIIERPNPGGPTATKVLLLGNVFASSSIPSDALSSAQQTLLPARMREDLETRNKVNQALGVAQSYWKLRQLGTAVDLASIKCRWYETSIVAPIVHEQPNFFECARSGRGQPLASKFNARIDLNPSAGARFSSRESAFGSGAVPKTLKLVEGFSTPKPHELPQRAETVQPQYEVHGSSALTNTTTNIDDFINLTAMDDSMPGYSQDYGHQENFFQ